jgi:hypothetical protein
MSKSKIIISTNLKTKNISINADSIGHRDSVLHFYFVDGNNPVKFNGLSFSYTISKDGSVVATRIWPDDPSLETYIQCDPNSLFSSDKAILSIDEDYSMTVSVTHNGSTFTETQTISTGRPAKPFTAWIWSDDKKKWEPPVVRPTDETKPWIWSDEHNKWIERDRCVYGNAGSLEPKTKEVSLIRDKFMKKLSETTLPDGTNLLTKAETAFTNNELDGPTKIKWQYGTTFKRMDAEVILWGDNLSLTADQLDDIFDVSFSDNT